MDARDDLGVRDDLVVDALCVHTYHDAMHLRRSPVLFYVLCCTVGLASAGCSHSGQRGRAPNVPAESAGDIPIVIANNSGMALCTMALVSDGVPVRNWLGSKIGPGADVEFRVRPNTYSIAGLGCDQQSGFTYLSYTVTGPTYVSIGSAPTSPRAGYTLITVPQGTSRAPDAPKPSRCVSAGERPLVTTDCCSGKSHNVEEFEICD